jgi:hypothetical protein
MSSAGVGWRGAPAYAMVVAGLLVMMAPAGRRRPRRRFRCRRRDPRALGSAHVAHYPGEHRDAGARRARQRVQHPARPGPRPRRRLLPRRPRAAPPGFAPTARHVRSAGDGAGRGARGRPARARLGQRQPGVERSRTARLPRPPRVPPSRMADDPARPRARTLGHRAREPGLRRRLARWTRNISTEVEGLYSSRSCRPPPPTPKRSSRHRPPLRRWTASISTTPLSERALRLQQGRDRRVPRRSSASGSATTCAASSTRARWWIRWPTPTRSPITGAASASRA